MTIAKAWFILGFILWSYSSFRVAWFVVIEGGWPEGEGNFMDIFSVFLGIIGATAMLGSSAGVRIDGFSLIFLFIFLEPAVFMIILPDTQDDS
jgi:hypothetical protein